MLDDIQNQIKDFADFEERDLKLKHGDEIFPIIENSSLFISYDYLLCDNSEFSFINEEFHQKHSEEYKDKTDYQVYFEKVKRLCTSTFLDAEEDSFNFKTISPNKNLKKVLEKIYNINNLKAEQTPDFIEIRLYTNRRSKRAPRIFGFLGHANVIYILIYDPFHNIFDKNKPK